jgi:hypothetical protein
VKYALNNDGNVEILLTSFTGKPCHMHERTQAVINYVRHSGHLPLTVISTVTHKGKTFNKYYSLVNSSTKTRYYCKSSKVNPHTQT